MNVRVACAEIIAAIIRNEASLNSLLPLYQDRISPRDASLLQEFCFGTLRHMPALEVILEHLLEKPIKIKEAEVSALLMAALYQIRELRTPDHAAVNETVGALRALNKTWAKGLINGVLRRYLRDRDGIDVRCRTDSRYQHLHPLWLQKMLLSAWPDHCAQIMAANNQRPPMSLRVNQRRISRDDYLELLRAAQTGASAATWSAQGIYLDQPCNVTELPGFGEGLVSVQDEAAQLCAPLLDLHPGQRVLDACCAPGGKTCHILESEQRLSSLLALDVDEKRLSRVAENLSRLQLSAELVSADAGHLDSWWDGCAFDRILLDAPCSASGVIRRHPDIKMLRKAGDIAKLADVQIQLLTALWPTLNSGGKLLYATCSVLPEENDQVIQQFAARHESCEVAAIDTPWGIATASGKQMLPTPQGPDGFYYGLLVKR